MSIQWIHDSTHVDMSTKCFYKKVDGVWHLVYSDGTSTKSGSLYNGETKESELVERQPKQWSGPQDGLPPVNTECELRCKTGGWGIAKVKYMSETMCVWLWQNGNPDQREWAESPWKMDFRPIRTAADIAAEQRETAIREIMDIADVDCRVTAARLVDAGFKREVV